MTNRTAASNRRRGSPDYTYRVAEGLEPAGIHASKIYGTVIGEYFYENRLSAPLESKPTPNIDSGPVDKSRLYTLREAARQIRLDRSGTLKRAIEDGLIKAVQVGSATRISGEELARILREGLPAIPGGRRPSRNAKRRTPTKRTRPSVGSIAKIPL